MIVEQKVTLEGIVTMLVMEAGNVVKRLRFFNLIVNSGLDALGAEVTPQTASRYCQVGTGSSTPVATQTELDNRVATSGSIASQSSGTSGGTPWYQYRLRTFDFGLGGAVGNFSEVGFSGDTSSNLFSRALIKDAEGNPTTLTVRDDQQLYVTYELRLWSPANDAASTVEADIRGVPTDIDVVVRAAMVSGGNWSLVADVPVSYLHTKCWETDVLGGITSLPSGSGTGYTSYTKHPYTPGNYYRDFTVFFGATNANFTTGIGAIVFNNKFQVSFNPKLNKTDNDSLSVTFRTHFGRHAA